MKIISDYYELVDWLRYEAGSSNPDYFLCKKAGGYQLQQVPEEFAGLLLFLRSERIESYLELGLGNGGSFEIVCSYLPNLKFAVAVDNLSYGAVIEQTREGIEARIKNIKADCKFYKMDTDEFFKINKNKFDAILIDAGHTYNEALDDSINSMGVLNDGGCLIFHDINSLACPGIKTLWKELKSSGLYKDYREFIYSDVCGIGVLIV